LGQHALGAVGANDLERCLVGDWVAAQQDATFELRWNDGRSAVDTVHPGVGEAEPERQYDQQRAKDTKQHVCGSERDAAHVVVTALLVGRVDHRAD